MSPASSSAITPDFLIRGADYLAEHPHFKLIGRQPELNASMDALLRKSTGNNLVLYGPGGVGLSSIVMGLQAAKDDPATPFDIVSKNFYYLDVDALFSLSDPAAINEGFRKAMDTLQKSSDSVLVIEDTKGFLDGVQNNNVSNMVNALMRDVKPNQQQFQTIFVAADADLPALLKSHSDIAKNFTMQDVGEPPKDELREIIESAVKDMEEQYGIAVSKEAVDSVTELTAKYPGLTLGVAQPKRSILLLEGAMTAYCRTAHTQPPELEALEQTLTLANAALDSGSPRKEN